MMMIVLLVLSALSIRITVGASALNKRLDDDYYSLASRFVHYSVYFKSYESVLEDSLTCGKYDLLNRTAVMFHDSVIQCASDHYRPRRLSASQISWKQADDDTKGNITHRSKRRAKPRSDTGKNGTFMIHNYFGLALLLPNHPFSSDLSGALTSTGRIFPMVTFSVGNGYEFNELCMQYGITSFPKLLFFKNGLLLGTYKGEYTAAGLAAQVSKWTGNLPQAVPLRQRSISPRRSVQALKTSDQKLEPILLISPEKINLDFYVYILSTIYFGLRVLQYLTKATAPPPIM